MKRPGGLAAPLDASVLRTLGALPHGILVLDADLQLLFVNPAFVALTAWPDDAVRGRTLGFDDGPFADAAWLPALREAIAAGREFSTETWCRRRAGRAFWSELSLAPVRDVGGRLLHWVGELRDIERRRHAEEEQRSTDKRYRDLVENVPAGVVVHGPGSEIRLANQEASRLLGLSLEQLLGRVAIDPRWHFQHEDGRPFALHEYPVNRVLATGEALQHMVGGIHHPDGERLVWVICNAFPVFAHSGELSEVIVSFTDVTGLKQAELELHESEERLRLVLRGSSDAPWDWDLVQDRLYYSPRWWHMLGYEVDELPADAKLWARLLHPDDTPAVDAQLERVFNGGAESFEIEFRLQHCQGHHVPVLCRGFVLRNEAGEPIRMSGTNLDLTERKRAEAQIHHLAFYDGLTELPNRRFLVEQLRKALLGSTRSQMRGAVLFIDLDHFKELNDTMGHDVGDALLRQVAERLRACVRETDTVARLGGDEFVVMLENLHPDTAEAALEAERVGKKVLEALNRRYDIDGHPYHGTPSLGITLFDGQSEGVDALLRQADLAMYQAKAMGRNTMRFFDASMQASVDQRVALEADLREGLGRGELLLHYQPQLDASGAVVGAEALVRWQHPRRGLVPPAVFIPLAESTGLILPLGRWVLQQACEQLARWADRPETAGLSLAVNVSVHQFRDPGFVDQVLAVLSATQARPQALKLELTESVLADNIEDITRQMQQLKAHGVAFSLDDFGTGYSSLGYLKHLPLDQLKIDASFVRDVLTDPSDATIARIIITLARELQLSVIAEGVETQAQRDFLVHNGCAEFQGYLFARPMPLEAFEAFVAAACQTSQMRGR
jgi:diguanylate cyclase (GGDEF)-like protein/PAS domain S-box-containing protein